MRALKISDPSYELMDDHHGNSLIYREHGFPCPLVRWHNHKEYELHLIVASSGKVFVGDYVGNFGPNSLFLTGPHLPHNWISQVEEGEVVAKRDMLVNFTDEVLESGTAVFAELKSLAPLLRPLPAYILINHFWMPCRPKAWNLLLSLCTSAPEHFSQYGSTMYWNIRCTPNTSKCRLMLSTRSMPVKPAAIK